MMKDLAQDFLRIFVFAMAMLTGAHNASAGESDAWSRTIKLRIAADKDSRQRPDWEREIRSSINSVSAIWERAFGIRWEVVDVVPWDAPADSKFLSTGELFGHLKANIALSNADAVLGIGERQCLDHMGGLNDFFGASALAMTRCLRQHGERNTLDVVISHEFAHMFGAFHVRPHIRSVMSGDGPELFDPQTKRVIFLTRDKPFSGGMNAVRSLGKDKEAAISAIYAEGHLRESRDPIATAYLVMGQTLLQQNKYDEALGAFQQAAKIEARWSSPYVGMGLAYEKQSKLDQATAAYKTALTIDSTDAQANELLAYIKVNQGDEKGAVQNYEAAAAASPKSAAIRNNLGVGYMSQGKPDRAETEFREALRLDASTADVRSNLGAALGMQGKFDEAVRILREAIRLDPADGKAQANLGFTLEQMGDYRGAMASYRKALVMDPANERNRINLERLQRRMGVIK